MLAGFVILNLARPLRAPTTERRDRGGGPVRTSWALCEGGGGQMFAVQTDS